MSFTWQEGVALLVVAAAAWHLLQRTVAAFRGQRAPTCGSCSKCSTDGQPPVEVVEIQHLKG